MKRLHDLKRLLWTLPALLLALLLILPMQGRAEDTGPYTVEVEKVVKIEGGIDPADVDMTVYFALKQGDDFLRDEGGNPVMRSVSIVDGAVSGSAVVQFTGLSAGRYDVWEVDADCNPLSAGMTLPGNENIMISSISTMNGPTNSTNNAEVDEETPVDRITVHNVFNAKSNVIDFVAVKGWYPYNLYQSDRINTEVPEDARVVFTIYELDSDIPLKTVTLDGKVDEKGEQRPWEAHFTDMPMKDLSGNEIRYMVKETDVRYTSNYKYYTFYGNSPSASGLRNDPGRLTQNGGTIKNMPLYGNLILNKAIDSQPTVEGGLRETSQNLKFHITGPYGYDETVTLNYESDWNFRKVLERLPAGIYTIEELGMQEMNPTRNWIARESSVRVTTPIAGENDQDRKGQTVISMYVGTGGSSPDYAEYRPRNIYQGVRELVNVTARKVWQDGDDVDRIRPESVEVTLSGKAGNETVTVPGAVQTLSEENNWKYTWSNLAKKLNGTDITYSLTETETEVITGTDTEGQYAYEVTGSAAKGFTVTNTHTHETVDVSVKKVWQDGDDQDRIRPESVEVTLSGKAGNETVTVPGAVQTLDADGSWKYTWTGLDKTYHGKEITYTLTETETDVITGTDAAGQYAYEVTGSAAAGFTVTNTHTPEALDISVKKVWQDGDDQDQIGRARWGDRV